MGQDKSEVIPWSLVIGVSIDCLVDGLLVGLTYIASARAGYIMALATSIESCFLGISLSSSVYNATADRKRHVMISLAPVAALLLGGCIAGMVGHKLEENEALFAGFVTFAIVSLLFLVTQELLLTAHHITDDKALWLVPALSLKIPPAGHAVAAPLTSSHPSSPLQAIRANLCLQTPRP